MSKATNGARTTTTWLEALCSTELSYENFVFTYDFIPQIIMILINFCILFSLLC